MQQITITSNLILSGGVMVNGQEVPFTISERLCGQQMELRGMIFLQQQNTMDRRQPKQSLI
jgi:hypothetical protein